MFCDHQPMLTNRATTVWRSRRTIMLVIAAATAIALLAFAHGCSSWVAHALVDAPNRGKPVDDDADATALQNAVSADPDAESPLTLRIDVGPPHATLALWIIDPPRATDAPPLPRGTILVLHGIRDSKRTQTGISRSLANAGYRAVLVDLRGHGESTGEWLTYGIVESRDLVQALDELASRDLLVEPIGVMGCSYGGAIGLQLADIDSRIKAVVAIAAFANVRDVVRCYARQWGMSWLLSEATIDEGMRQAGELAGCDLSQADPVVAAARSKARILLIHGRGDANIPYQHSERIAGAAGDRARLILLDDEDHVSIMRDRGGVIAREAVDWFHQNLTAED
jgi:dipeptidyl aminopeptidase/acylaminoacyl peptidase